MKPSAYLRLLALLLPAFSLLSCEKDITDTVHINTKPELVVTAFISPQDTAFEVRVSKTRPVVGRILTEEEARVKDATVRISHGGRSVLLSYHAERQRYRARASLLPVMAGQTYTLQVTTPDNYIVTGSCTVPSTEGVVIKDLQHAARKERWYDTQDIDQHTFSFSWQDAPGRENYYHVFAEREMEDPQVHTRVRFAMTGDEEALFSDEKKDGLVFSGSRSYIIFPGQPDPRPADLHLYLAVTDRAYYRYHQSLEQHQEANGNPFAEPVLVYSNVTGGMGIFAAYNQLKATLRVE